MADDFTHVPEFDAVAYLAHWRPILGALACDQIIDLMTGHGVEVIRKAINELADIHVPGIGWTDEPTRNETP